LAQWKQWARLLRGLTVARISKNKGVRTEWHFQSKS
jgi:hypothetical protein